MKLAMLCGYLLFLAACSGLVALVIIQIGRINHLL